MEHKNRLGSRLQIRKIKKELVFPTLFSRLVTVYISILMMTLVFLFVVFTNAFQSYFVAYTQDIMIKQADNIAKEYYKVGIYGRSTKDTLEKILFRIQVMDSYLQSTTWLIDRSNTIVVVSENSNVPFVDKTIPDAAVIKKVFDGNIVKIEDGFKEYFSTPVLTIGYPVEVLGQIQYALFIHTPMPLILQTIDEVRNIILKVVSITATLALIWIYIISKQMTKPLKEMNTVAKQIASGQFDKRLEVTGQDEIAELGLSLNHMATELDKIEESRRKFIANVSHDLRSPLTSIQGFVTALLDGTIPKDNQEKYLNIVLGESQRMITMTNTILELSKMEEGSTPIQKVTFNITTMIKGILATFEPIAKQKNVYIESIFEEDEPYVMADIDMIARVIQNLLDNAFKFVDDNGIIKITTSLKNNKMVIGIGNSGEPITEQEQKDIWNRFYKGDASRGKYKKGLGLGLVIVKEIIKLHDETIEVSSNADELVTFTFTISTSKKL
ncbi:sensor histidine kinase [Cellulosilyticum sp. I15G10I2]|uniref:sensor histidine kinase n=1 Tax=Cellulosilyticum sp. I15G10I2 TaxID=1892843 RepID=UPI00085C8159|nr:HAMP domain-containing sensor histidine kinase [Cellulosilyticum sp. I15G10I2]